MDAFSVHRSFYEGRCGSAIPEVVLFHISEFDNTIPEVLLFHGSE